MVKVVRNVENKVPIKVVSLIDYSGFSAMLEINGITKSVDALDAKSPSIVFSADEIAALDGSAYGTFTVYNKEGEVHVIYKILFKVVDTPQETQGFVPVRIVIVSSFKYEVYGSSSDEEIARKVDDAVEKAMSESIDAKVEDVVDSIIDDKVDEAVGSIIDPKVEKAVDAVIDTKVEESVNELFESSDSDTVGGMINGLHDKVEGDIQPRLTNVEGNVNDDLYPRLSAVETALDQKVSVDHEESDENIQFFTSGNEDSSEEE